MYDLYCIEVFDLFRSQRESFFSLNYLVCVLFVAYTRIMPTLLLLSAKLTQGEQEQFPGWGQGTVVPAAITKANQTPAISQRACVSLQTDEKGSDKYIPHISLAVS